MLHRIVMIVAVILTGLSVDARDSSGQSSLLPGAYVAGELLVAGKPGVTDIALENIYSAKGGKKIQAFPQIGVHHVAIPIQAQEQIQAALAKHPNIQFAEKNYIGELSATPNDPTYPSQWHLPRISAPTAWDTTTGSSSIVIAIPDSGIDTAHPDLPNVVTGKNFLTGTTVVNDTGASGGHGTAVSGVAAAAGNNSIGVSGVSWKNPIMPLVVVDSAGWFTYSNLISAINHAADNGAKVISMSLVCGSYSASVQSAVDYAWGKGLVLVAAAGNNASSTIMYPAGFNNVIAVSATETNDTLASFSNFGSWIDVAAPGNWIYTTNLGGGYGAWYGTSVAAPQVAALAALIFSKNSTLTNSQVVDIIKNNADDLGSAGFDNSFGMGRINAYRALSAVGSAPALATSITSPASGSTVSGVITVSASVSSLYAVTKVELYVDNILYATDTFSPYSFSFDTAPYIGSHSLTVKAYDSAGNVASSPSVTVTVASVVTTDTTAPTVQLTSVTYDGKFINASATASDAGGVVKVEFYVDGVLKSTDDAAPWSAKINAQPLKTGSHVVTAKAYDAAGNSAVSGSLSITTTK